MVSKGGMLKYLKHSEIDKSKWDKCINNAVNPMVYNLSSYLDIIHPNWEGYVYELSGVYAAVMPVLTIRKFGFKILSKPALAQQLGLTYLPDCDIDLIFQQLKLELIQQFQILEYPLNYKNSPNDIDSENIELSLSSTQILHLNRTYEEIKSGYSRNRNRSLKQALKNNLILEETTDPSELMTLFSKNVINKIDGGVNTLTLERIKNLIHWGLVNNIGYLYVVRSTDQQPLSAGFFTLFANRVTSLFGATSETGRLLQANTLLFDYVIHANSEKNYIFDFGGSSVESIRGYFQRFGSEDEKFLILNHQSPVFQKLLNTRKKIYQLLKF